MEFLTNVFLENGYEKEKLLQTIELSREQQSRASQTNRDENKKYVSLPWVPGLSSNLKKVFRTAGYQPVFKSGKNLRDILSAKNKPKLHKNSYSGVYKIDCGCGKSYIGETGKQVATRLKEHEKSTNEGRWEKSAVAEHSRLCRNDIMWEEGTKTIAIETNKFQRKVREALEIQYYETAPKNNGLNQDDGKYVTTTFWKPFFSFLRNKNKKRENIVLPCDVT